MSKILDLIWERLDWAAVGVIAFVVSAFGGVALAYSGWLQ